MITLGIESSCDETSVALVEDGRKILSNVISSQIDTHKLYGGVVPEIASRQHVEAINLVLDQALREAGMTLEDVDVLGVTRGPGLIGALLVGLSAAKALALALDKPLVGVNHMHGHICANYLAHPDLEPPFISLVVSGGHTYLLEVEDYLTFKVHGQTRDDAAGEAFDKVARALGIGYPGGPIVDKLAKEGQDIYDFPRVFLEKDSYDFSFSGLKTAVMNFLNQERQKGHEPRVQDVCASFQGAVMDVLVEKSMKLLKDRGHKTLVLSGGVAANSYLKERLEKACQAEGFKLYYPPNILCTDNGAMIASASYYTYQKNAGDCLLADPNLGILSTETRVQ